MRLKKIKYFLSQRFGEVEDLVKLRRLEIQSESTIQMESPGDMIIEAHSDGTPGEYSSLGPCRL
jgi:hypothetical protein